MLKFASDPVEAEAVSRAFFDGKLSNSKPETGRDPLYVGSIKTVLGHTEGYVSSKDIVRFIISIFLFFLFFFRTTLVTARVI